MANFGKPDYDHRTHEQQAIDREAPDLRAKLKSEGKLYMWPYNQLVSPGYPPDIVQEYCVQNAEWQKVRLSMKGVPTHQKLAILVDWWHQHQNDLMQHHSRIEVQVGNYLGALRRGGQLDAHNQVRRYI